MKQIGCILGFIFFAVQLSIVQNDWENEQVIEINKEPVHATFFPLSSVDDAFGNGMNSEWVKLWG